MSRLSALLAGFWLFGAAVGAATTGIAWSFWACWAVAWFGLIRLVWGRRPKNGNGNGAAAHG